MHQCDDVKWSGGEENITIIGKEMDEAYIEMVKGLSVYPEVIEKQNDLKIVYTPIHGTGITLVPEVLKRFGFTNVTYCRRTKQHRMEIFQLLFILTRKKVKP